MDHSSSASLNTTSAALATPPELQQTLNILSQNRKLLGYLLLSRNPLKIIQHSGVVFDGEQGRRYSAAVAKIVESVNAGLDEVDPDGTISDEVRVIRIRTKRHELMILPDQRYALVVLHDPSS